MPRDRLESEEAFDGVRTPGGRPNSPQRHFQTPSTPTAPITLRNVFIAGVLGDTGVDGVT
jgi:hypothetical protein